MLAGTSLPLDTVVTKIPPSWAEATVEKIAINSVMAGCRPDYLPVVIAAVRAITQPALNLNGMQSSTHLATPLVVVNGPIRGTIGINSGANVFGQGWRANATIGRAVKLILTNIGRAIPGVTDKSTYLNTGDVPGRRPPEDLHGQIVPYGTYRAADDGYVNVCVPNNRFWAAFCAAMGIGALASDPRFATNAARVEHRAELDPTRAFYLGATGALDRAVAGARRPGGTGALDR